MVSEKEILSRKPALGTDALPHLKLSCPAQNFFCAPVRTTSTDLLMAVKRGQVVNFIVGEAFPLGATPPTLENE